MLELAGVGVIDDESKTTLNFLALVAVPPGVSTSMKPLDALVGTRSTSSVGLSEMRLAAIPSKVTLVPCPRLVPLMVTSVPTGPDFGLKLVMVGSGVEADASMVD